MAVVDAQTVQGLAGMPPLKQLGMMIALAASVALGVAVVLWSREPAYTVLYGSLDERSASQVVDALQKTGIPYQVDSNSGAILVPNNQLQTARMQLAGEGLPGSVGSGFAMLEGKQGFGTSQFMETARYQHALETELSKTIGSLRNVQEARVHLAIPKRSVFLRKQERPTASVVVHLYAGRGLADDQVSAIVNMVASSVPHLSPNDVTVVDQLGNLLTTQDASGMIGMSSSQFVYTRKLENSYADRIHGLLAPLVGNNGVRAEVTADIDFTQVEKTQESYNPDLPALRSEQVSEESLSGNAAAVGVPGTLSNQPPGAGTTGDAGVTAPPAATGSSTRRSTRNYELDKTISHTKLATGVVRKLSIAVLIDNKQDANGETVAWSDQELDKFGTLVKEAVGFDGARGDSVQILNVAFQPAPELAPPPEPGLLEQPWIWDLGKQVLGGLGVLLLFFGVLKPVMRSLAERGQQEQATLAAALEQAQQQQEALAAPAGANGLPAPPAYENQIDTAKQMVAEDPKRVAQLMKTWVNEE